MFDSALCVFATLHAHVMYTAAAFFIAGGYSWSHVTVLCHRLVMALLLYNPQPYMSCKSACGEFLSARCVEHSILTLCLTAPLPSIAV